MTKSTPNILPMREGVKEAIFLNVDDIRRQNRDIQELFATKGFTRELLAQYEYLEVDVERIADRERCLFSGFRSIEDREILFDTDTFGFYAMMELAQELGKTTIQHVDGRTIEWKPTAKKPAQVIAEWLTDDQRVIANEYINERIGK